MQRKNGRKDILSGKIFPVEELNRFVYLSSHLLFDKDNNLGGRGVYLQKGEEAFSLAKKKNLFSKALRRQINPLDLEKIYEEDKEKL